MSDLVRLLRLVYLPLRIVALLMRIGGYAGGLLFLLVAGALVAAVVMAQ